LSHGVRRRIDGPTAGFTIIEALLALTVVTITITAIGSVMASTTRGTRQLEGHVALVQAANDILWLDLPARAGPITSQLSGRTMDHEWRMAIQPLLIDADATAGEAPWFPVTIRLQVQSPSGSMINLQTVRLFDRKTAK
jgi:general secretion pathway protein I